MASFSHSSEDLDVYRSDFIVCDFGSLHGHLFGDLDSIPYCIYPPSQICSVLLCVSSGSFQIDEGFEPHDTSLSSGLMEVQSWAHIGSVLKPPLDPPNCTNISLCLCLCNICEGAGGGGNRRSWSRHGVCAAPSHPSMACVGLHTGGA